MQIILTCLVVLGAVSYLVLDKMPMSMNIKLGNNLRKSKIKSISRFGLKMLSRGCKNCK